jgi:hypothetical protein
MILKQIYNTDHKSQILIDLPESFRNKKKILVVLDDSVDIRTEKMEFMKKAQNDPLFFADINSVIQDFEKIDNESI